jgi:hypothetical protein
VFLLAGASAFLACDGQEREAASGMPRADLMEEGLHAAWEHMGDLGIASTSEERANHAGRALTEFDRALEGRPRSGNLYWMARWQRLYAMTALPEEDVVAEGVDLANSDPAPDLGQLKDIARWLREAKRDAEAKQLVEFCEPLLKR